MHRKKITAALAALCAFALAAVLVFAACELGEAEAPQKNILKPYISVQPRGASYYTDEAQTTALSVEVWDWDGDDGNLSYQWYTFADVEEYCNTGGTAISGATGTEYTPSPAVVADKSYFYYVVVTNNNSDALDMTRASTQSEVAAISFSAPGDPLVPVIWRHPVSATYGWGAALNALRVDAEELPKDEDGNPKGTLSYQWFFNKAYSVENGGESIAQANQRSLMPDYDMLDLGDSNNFFAVVTNTLSGKTRQATSIPAVITIEPGARAAAPRIMQQPKDQLYFTGSAIQPLTVTAESLDRGALSYQWYTNTSALNKNGEEISGATGASYNPPVDANTEGNNFYYVVITNENQNVRGDKTAATASRAVKVRVAAAADVSAITPNIFVSIPDPSLAENRFQYIRGYGGTDVGWGNFPLTKPEDTELMYDPDRLGYNMLRIMIMPDNIDMEKTMADLIAGDRPYYYENVKIVNKHGGYVAASPWTPPKEWKSNNSINGGGHLIPSYYALFANYLRNFAQHMYDHGAPIFAISISNEPNYVAGYDGCEWEPEQMRDFYLQVGHFTDGIRGYGGGRETPYVWTMNGESANTPLINSAALANAQSRAVIDVLARHIYGERRVNLWANPTYGPLLNRPDGTKTEVWMTEHNINSANAIGYYNDSRWDYIWRFLNDVDIVIRLNNENAFVWWASKRFYSMVGDGQFGTTESAPLPRGYALSHYARFTIGTTRININVDTTNSYMLNADGTAFGDKITHVMRSNSILNNDLDDMDNAAGRITAFVSEDGNEISMVLWTPTNADGTRGYNMGMIKVDFPEGFEAQSVTAVRSTGDRDWQIFQPEEIQLSPDRKSAYINMPRSQLLSVRFSK